MTPDKMVWWLHSHDIAALATRFTALGPPEEFGCYWDGETEDHPVHPSDLPCAPEVYAELRSILGRPLRGRLWAPSGMVLPEGSATLPDQLGEDARHWGGIVIKADRPCLPARSPGWLATWDGRVVEITAWEIPPQPTRLHMGFLPSGAYLPGPPRTALPWTYAWWWTTLPAGSQIGTNDVVLASALDDATRVVLHGPDGGRVMLAESPVWSKWSDRMDVGECAWMVLREWAPPRADRGGGTAP